MDRLFKTYGRLLAQTDLNFTRYLYGQINWDNRLIVIKGAKGVGKTTILLQHILRALKTSRRHCMHRSTTFGLSITRYST